MVTVHFIGPYQILKKVGEVAYKFSLPTSLLNLHNVFHVSQLQNYVPDPSHVILMEDVQVRDNLTVDASPLRIYDREVKHLSGKYIVFVKVVWVGPVGGSMTWEMESQMKEYYLELFNSVDV
ncbi:uncharacterized protein LOC127091902 [Lathyrus oleraceus]|uniref:uncharacterized protein LOC127091902 n=1 Tax=Pisum sativum TaxID=3888 RepID=UPI0021CEDFE8|nr:uncharacterized protein LOC127091902 [Pisum sativum]